MIRVGVAGAAGRVGAAVCAAVEGADDMELTGRADPALGVALADILGDCDVVVDFTTPDAALDNALACVRRRRARGRRHDRLGPRAAARIGPRPTPPTSSSPRTSPSAPCS